MAEGDVTREPIYVEAQRSLVRLVECRFTGIIVAAIIAGWLAASILQQLGYGTVADSLGRIAELAFVSYVVKKSYQTTNGNGNGAK
jgi:hypothetical protein